MKNKKSREEKVIDEIGMAELPLIIHKLYKMHLGRYKLIDIGGDCMFRFGSTNVANVSYLATYIHFINIKADVLTIEGNVSWPSVLKKHFKFYVSVNGKKQECEMFDAGFDLKCNRETYETRTAFLFKQELSVDESVYEIKFVYECNGIECYSGKINSMRFSPVADLHKSQYAVRNGWVIKVDGNKLILMQEGKRGFIDYENAYQKEIEDESVKILRNKFFNSRQGKQRPIWLFMDRIDKADDNGEAFFKYVVEEENPDADCFFVISKNSPDYNRLKQIGNVIDALSEEHQLYFLLADYIFTSQLNGWAENPFGEKEEYFRDLYHQAKVVFLQHGVTKDDQTRWLDRYNQNLYAIVTSSEEERKSFLKYPYHYKENQIWNTGMPRLDRLYSEEQKYILFMPTWRQAVMEQRADSVTKTYRWYPKDNFKESKYCKYYSKVLSNEKFIDECEKEGYKVVFMPHPIVQPYIDMFELSHRVQVLDYETSWRDIFAKSNMMITDYSSVAFDFAYLKKPVIYYQFDKREFFIGHTYKEGYFDYQDMGFGEVVRNEKELFAAINKYMSNHFMMSETYKERVDRFYTYTDKKCCRRLYEKL